MMSESGKNKNSIQIKALMKKMARLLVVLCIVWMYFEGILRDVYVTVRVVGTALVYTIHMSLFMMTDVRV